MTQRASAETAKIDIARCRAVASTRSPPTTSKLDRYEIKRPLGRGGFSTVYEAYDPRIKRSVAIKQCSSLDQSNHDRFFREAEIAGNLSHANIVRIFDFGVAEGTPFIVQELLGGKDLADWIESGLELSNHDRVRILLEVAKGLAYAHSHGVIHRDVKPANVRILEDGSIKLLDFGVAAIQEEPSKLTQTGTTVGTAAYLAPEQIRGERPNRATDIFSFGVLAYELLTGHRPFGGETLSAVLYQIAHQQPETLQPGALPGQLIRLVHRCLAKQGSQRPAGFVEITEELEEALRDPRLRPPSADTVPITTLPARGPGRGLAPLPSLANLPLGGRTPPVRDSSTRIQVARPRRRAGRVLLGLTLLLGALPLYAYLGGRLPEPVAREMANMESVIPQKVQAFLDLFREPAPLPIPVGVPAKAAGYFADSKPLAPAPPTVVPDDLDPVTAAIASLDAQRRSTQLPAKPKPRTRSSTVPATLFLPPGWHPRMMVSTDGGGFQALDRRRTRKLRAGLHKLTFKLDTASYRTVKTVEIQLEPAESRTVESPLAPPGALEIAIVPASVSGRLEIDGRQVQLPLRAPEILEPGTHRLVLYPSPGDALGPLTKTVNLASARSHVVTFDIRRRRAAVESDSAFPWDG